MELRILTRQPRKLILCTLFLGCMAVVALFFALQYCIDRTSANYIAKAYACTGTISPTQELGRTDRRALAVQPMEREVIDFLRAADTVSFVDEQQTFSGRVEGSRNVAEGLMYRNHGGRLVAVDVAVPQDAEIFLIPLGYGPSDYAQKFQVKRDFRILAAHAGWSSQVYQPFIQVAANEDGSPAIEPGRRYLVVGYVEKLDYTGWGHQASSVVNVGMLMTADDVAMNRETFTTYYPPTYASYLENIYLPGNAVIPLESDATDEEVTALLEQRGLLPYLEQVDALDEVYTVRGVGSMDMVPSVKDGGIVYPEGRGLTLGDAGKNVCVVSCLLANENRWSVGDKIPLALAGGCYDVSGNLMGFPMLGELMEHSYGQAEEYEIVGLFKHRDYDTWTDSFSPSLNTIFIPRQEGYESGYPTYPYAFGFQVAGADSARFREETEPALRRMGYDVQMNYSSWSSVSDIFGDIDYRRGQTLAAAMVTLAASCVLYALVLHYQYRREFALRKLLGAPFREAWRAYGTPLAVSGALSGIAAVGAAYLLYAKLLRPEMEAVAPDSLPGSGQIVLLLTVIYLAQVLLCAGLLWILARRAEKAAVRVLVKK